MAEQESSAVSTQQVWPEDDVGTTDCVRRAFVNQRVWAGAEPPSELHDTAEFSQDHARALASALDPSLSAMLEGAARVTWTADKTAVGKQIESFEELLGQFSTALMQELTSRLRLARCGDTGIAGEMAYVLLISQVHDTVVANAQLPKLNSWFMRRGPTAYGFGANFVLLAIAAELSQNEAQFAKIRAAFESG